MSPESTLQETSEYKSPWNLFPGNLTNGILGDFSFSLSDFKNIFGLLYLGKILRNWHVLQKKIKIIFLHNS